MNRVSATSSFLLQIIGIAASVGLVACEEGDPPVEHGVIKLELVVSKSDPVSPLPRTARIQAAMSYQVCLQAFYNENTAYQPGGEIGSTVFGPEEDGGEGWLDRLCADPEGGQIACEVDMITQRMPQLAIEFNMTSDPIEGQFLKFGPIPRASLAGCEPEMGFDVDPVSGYDANGVQIWHTELFGRGEASPESSGEVQITISAVDPDE